MRYCLVIAILFLSSCSVQYHLKESKKHYDRAISLGYKPRLDTIIRINTIGKIPIDYKPNIRLYFNNVVDTILEKYCDDLKGGNFEKANKSKESLKKMLIDSYKYIDVDTLVRFPDGSAVHIMANNGQLSVKQKTACLEDRVIIEDKYWHHKA